VPLAPIAPSSAGDERRATPFPPPGGEHQELLQPDPPTDAPQRQCRARRRHGDATWRQRPNPGDASVSQGRAIWRSTVAMRLHVRRLSRRCLGLAAVSAGRQPPKEPRSHQGGADASRSSLFAQARACGDDARRCPQCVVLRWARATGPNRASGVAPALVDQGHRRPARSVGWALAVAGLLRGDGPRLRLHASDR
jgi:hypothetical protein